MRQTAVPDPSKAVRPFRSFRHGGAVCPFLSFRHGGAVRHFCSLRHGGAVCLLLCFRHGGALCSLCCFRHGGDVHSFFSFHHGGSVRPFLLCLSRFPSSHVPLQHIPYATRHARRDPFMNQASLSLFPLALSLFPLPPSPFAFPLCSSPAWRPRPPHVSSHPRLPQLPFPSASLFPLPPPLLLPSAAIPLYLSSCPSRAHPLSLHRSRPPPLNSYPPSPALL